MTSWKKTIASPFRKACTFFNQQQQQQPVSRDKKSQPGQEKRGLDLHGEVMACGYEDVQVMWSILDKSKSATCDMTTS
ncbi:hypothetical protein OIU85_025162 [Salix viminalis]|uniref:Uncharacterized protein n=2 Tax=Salix TaxID=40685 RepID=A0A9Q0U298_SALVM|nr:hypothetical protein OIU84_018362 [Salix udensis]KAJ6722162.1 hypothetical protein OIU85_025162 [Salix viminalis]